MMNQLPIELQNEVYKYVFNDVMKSLKSCSRYMQHVLYVLAEYEFITDAGEVWEAPVKTWGWEPYELNSMFMFLNYDGFSSSFNPNYSGAREIATYMKECWEPYIDLQFGYWTDQYWARGESLTETH